MAKKIQFGIFHRLLLTLLLVALLPLAVVWFFSLQASISLTHEKVEQQLRALNSNLSTHVEGWVDMNQRMLLQNAALRDIQSMQATRQNPVLKTISKLYDWAYLSFTLDPRGMNVGRSDGKKLKYYGDREYYKQVVEGSPFGKQILIGKTSGQPALILSTAINDTSGKLKGVLALAMTLTEISSEIVNSRIGETGYSFLLDEKGEVIAHPNEEFTRSRVDMSHHQTLQALAHGETFSMFDDYNGKKVVAVAGKTREGWTMISQQDYSEAYRLIEQEKLKAAGVLLVTFLIVLLLALVVSKRLTTPLLELTDVADQYSQGRLSLKITGLDRGDEIGQLAQAIERLGTSIRLAMERLQR